MISNLSYSQYPQVKKIGNDSVVLITLKQGNDINKQFTVLNDSIKGLNKTLELSKFDFNKYKVESGDKYSQLNIASLKYKAEVDSFRFMYKQNKTIYKKHEEWWNRDRQHYVSLSLVLMLATIFFAAL
jgi:hypothetical protein